MALVAITSTPASTPVIKRSHSEVASDDETISTVPLSCQRFTSKIIDIYVGNEKFHYAAHEAFIYQSEDLKNEYEVVIRTKRKSSKGPPALYLPRDTPKEFGQMLEYLYLKQLILHASDPQGQAEELLSIWTMGSKYSLLDMQKRVIRKLEELDIASKLPTLEFLRLADRLYESEVDNGLRRYFARVASDVVRKIKPSDMPVLLDMITEGGSFASDLFHAHHQAFGLLTPVAGGQSKALSKLANKAGQQQHSTKRVRTEEVTPSPSTSSTITAQVDVRTQWDNENDIPEAWETARIADQLLVTKVESGFDWPVTAEAWEKATGVRMSVDNLMHRYDRINANVLRLGKRDADLLFSAKSAIEAQFNTDKWHLIAARIVQSGGTEHSPFRLQRYCNALDAHQKSESKALDEEISHNSALVIHSGNGLQKYNKVSLDRATEIVGGVKVENSKPINVRRRHRARKAPTASQARTSTRARKRKERGDGSSDEDTELLSREATREVSALVVDDDEDEGPRETGVRVRNEKKGKVLGGMRVDKEVKEEVKVVESGMRGGLVEEVGDDD
ncbi:MAG: hypothetical protein Q9170_004576 [Blastenia crenularia]